MSRNWFQIVAAAAAFLSAPCGLRAQEPAPPVQAANLGRWPDDHGKLWWRDHPDPSAWPREAQSIVLALRNAQTRGNLLQLADNPHWAKWMLHARWLTLFPENWQAHPFFSEAAHREVFIALAQNARLRNELLANLSTQDDASQALTIYCRIAAAQPKELDRFASLAVAYAVVFDQPFPAAWPHSFVAAPKLATGNPDPVERFVFLLKCQAEKKLLHDLSRLSARDLTFLVDTPLEFKELQYAQQVDLGTPERLAQLYPAVKYDMNRIRSRNYLWPGPTYRLIDIGKQGGICMDQAFFVSETGKSQGVPTLLFVGQGLSGDHAWVGYLGGNGRWEMDVARYRGENYPIGLAYDPQTWERITDPELEALVQGSGRLGAGGALNRGQLLLQWAALNHGSELYPRILAAARREMAQDPRPWQMEADWLDESNAPAETRQAFWEEWVRRFADQPDLQVKGQMRIIGLLEESGKEREAENLRRDVMARNKSKRFDLGIAIAAEPVFRALRKRQWEVAEAGFESAMRRFRTQAGGHLYYNLLEPYVLTCLQENQVKMAADALKHLEKGFEVTPGTILDNDMRELTARVKAGGG